MLRRLGLCLIVLYGGGRSGGGAGNSKKKVCFLPFINDNRFFFFTLLITEAFGLRRSQYIQAVPEYRTWYEVKCCYVIRIECRAEWHIVIVRIFKRGERNDRGFNLFLFLL